MHRRFERRFVVPVVLLSLLLGVSAAAFAAPGDRKTLVLRGRVTDADGWPVAGARVTALGARRVSATGDDDGQFVLTLPLGPLADLARNPIALRVHAEQRGWRLALPGGETELGLELRVVAGTDGVARCEVRSNQPKVVSAIVRALMADGDATGVAVVNFIGVRGEAIGSPPDPELPIVDRVALAGVRVPIAPPPAVQTGPSKAEKKGASAAEAEIAKPKRSEETPTRDPEPTRQPVTAAPARSEPPAVLSPTPSDAEGEPADPKRPTSQERSLAREEAKRLREQARERDRLARLDRAKEKARAKKEENGRSAAEEELRREGAGHQERWEALRREVHLIAGASDTASPPPVAALDDLAGPPARAAQRSRVLVAPRLVPRRDTVAVPPPQLPPEPPPAAAAPVDPTPRAAAAPVDPTPRAAAAPVDPAPRAAAASAPESGVSPVRPRPEGESRARAGPLVIRVPGPRPAATAAPTAGRDSCTCRIEGTIEVDSDMPLPGRTRVAVSLAWYPAIADTVELFMGSPRGFSLPPAPCGPQRLRLANLGSTRFDVASRDAMAGFRCEPGTLRQFRIVLQPR
jgi:hypothetical protein